MSLRQAARQIGQGRPRADYRGETAGVQDQVSYYRIFALARWLSDGKSIVEHVAGVEDYQVALATYRAACQR